MRDTFSVDRASQGAPPATRTSSLRFPEEGHMHKLALLLILIAAELIANPVAAVAQILRVAALPRSPTAANPRFNNGVFAVGGMTGGGMMGDGMTSGG